MTFEIIGQIGGGLFNLRMFNQKHAKYFELFYVADGFAILMMIIM